MVSSQIFGYTSKVSFSLKLKNLKILCYKHVTSCRKIKKIPEVFRATSGMCRVREQESNKGLFLLEQHQFFIHYY